MQTEGKEKKCQGIPRVERLQCIDILFHENQLTPFSSQIWDETFQRVTNEQEIYEGLSQKFKRIKHLSLCRFIFQTSLSFPLFTDSSPASRPNAAEARELLPNHNHQTDQPVHPVYCQSQRETRAQVLYSEDILPSYCPSAAILVD